ncbi:MAG: metal-sensitive transcriptional regulator [Acidimicrobiales bacterium]
MQIEPEITGDLLKRLRRIEGQLGGIARMIEEGRECEDVVTQLAAASKALDRAGFKLVASGMRQCLDAKPGGSLSEADISRMERLFLSLA